MPIVAHQNRNIEYALKLKAWKRGLTLRIDHVGGVAVSAPKTARQRDVEEFVLQHADWIFKKKEYFRKRMAENSPKEFVSGESFPVLGKNHRLQVTLDEGFKKNLCQVEEGRLKVFLKAGGQNDLKVTVQRVLLDFYKTMAFQKLQENLEKYASILGVSPKGFRIGNQKSRWGSCSGKGNLRFNWRLAMTPPAILEYVAIHELCHLKHPNHSDRFWRMVQSVLPDYKIRRRWLRENSLSLFLV